MAEYIEREAAIEAVKHAFANGIEPSQYIEIIPAADVVPVVRCKDCTEWDEISSECSHWYGFRENDFCSYGERKDGETT